MGRLFSEAEGKIKEAIQETDGETLQYRNHYIYAAYHAVSAGNTRNMEELYPDSDMPTFQVWHVMRMHRRRIIFGAVSGSGDHDRREG